MTDIRLTHSISKMSLDFLDIKIIVENSGCLSTDVHSQKTSVNALLHASSFHPPHTIRSIHAGRFLRVRCICDTDKRFKQQAIILKSHFQQQGYHIKDIEIAYNHAKKLKNNCSCLLKPQKWKTSDQKVCFIITYNTQLCNIRGMFEQFQAYTFYGS